MSMLALLYMRAHVAVGEPSEYQSLKPGSGPLAVLQVTHSQRVVFLQNPVQAVLCEAAAPHKIRRHQGL